MIKRCQTWGPTKNYMLMVIESLQEAVLCIKNICTISFDILMLNEVTISDITCGVVGLLIS